MSKSYVQSLYQALCDMVEVLRLHGVVNVVLSPGSRSAPLALSFMRNGKFDFYHLVDERSAAYFGLGLAKASQRPTVLVCTSGTASYNYAPAVAEAYFQEIPLMVLTSDRPQEWVGQNDNQAIYQQEIFGQHVLQFTQMPQSYEREEDRSYALQKANEACMKATGRRKGPVHLNFPFKEPFYPEDLQVQPSNGLRLVDTVSALPAVPKVLLYDVLKTVAESRNIWILAGMTIEEVDASAIDDFAFRTGATVIKDPLCRSELKSASFQYDAWLKEGGIDAPDLVFSFGNHFLSKSLKQYLRANKPQNHIHLQAHETLADPFGSISFLMQSEVASFFEQFTAHLTEPETQPKRLSEEKDRRSLELFEPDEEFQMAGQLLELLPEHSVLHMGNSTPVRYLLRWQHLLQSKNIKVFANRGTSGIDGSVSTAMGMAQGDSRPHFLLIGDLSMYYDRNGLWHNYIPQDFSIIVMNNSGGGIFKRIKGPKEQAELEEYFVNAQLCDFQALAKAHGFQYHQILPETSDSLNLLASGRFLYEVVL